MVADVDAELDWGEPRQAQPPGHVTSDTLGSRGLEGVPQLLWSPGGVIRCMPIFRCLFLFVCTHNRMHVCMQVCSSASMP